MPIPDRWRPAWPSSEEVERFSEMCDRIEDRREGYEADLAAWNARASSVYEVTDFQTYYGSEDKETFVLKALLPAPAYDPSVTFEELVGVVRALGEDDLHEAEHHFLLMALEGNLPGSGISDLIYWPNAWFGNPDANPNDYALSDEQVVGYALRRSGRVVPGQPPGLELPFPMPG